MATFAPDVPSIGAPDWSKVTQPIQQPQSDKSVGLTLAALGEGLDEGAKLADTTEKGYLKDKVDDSVNSIRDQFTTGLVASRNAQLTGQTVPDPNNTLLAANDAPTPPPALQAGIAKAQAIGTAMNQNAGKLNDTLYTGLLNAQAKQLRAQYPGYKDYIDDQFKAVSGVDPANAYMKNLLQDVNQGATSAKSDQEKAISYGRENIGVDPHMPAAIEAVRQNLPGAVQNLEKMVAQGQYLDTQHKRYMADHQEVDTQNADDARSAQDMYRTQLTGKMQQLFNGPIEISGLTQPYTLSKLIADEQNGSGPKLTDEQNTQLLGLARAAQQEFNRQAFVLQNGPGGYAKRINDQAAVDKITNGVGQLFQQNVDAIGDKNYGTMFANKRRVDSIISADAPLQVLSNPDLGGYARQTAVWTQFGGPNWVNTANGQFLAQGGLGKFQNFLKDETMKSQVPDDPRQVNNVKSMYGAIQKAKQWAADNNESVPAKVYTNLVDNVNTITNPKAPDAVKTEVAKYAFNPKNWGIMNQFGQDFTETKEDGTTVQHKGRNSVFDTMTSPGITNSLDKLRRTTPDGDQVWNNYKNWSEQSFKTIFGEEVKTLNGISQDQSTPVKVTWDSDNRKFDIEYPQKPKTDIEANYQNSSKAVVQRLNAGLGNLTRVQDKEGQDTSAYLIKTLIDVGFRPGTEVGGLPQKIYDAIKSSHRSNANRIGDAFKAAQ